MPERRPGCWRPRAGAAGAWGAEVEAAARGVLGGSLQFLRGGGGPGWSAARSPGAGGAQGSGRPDGAVPRTGGSGLFSQVPGA